jgi:hypothetical protein
MITLYHINITMPRPKPDNIERIFIGSRISKAMIRGLKDIAYHEERPFYDVLEEAIAKYLRHKKKEGKGESQKPAR